MSNRKEIKIHIKPEQRKQYIRIPFDVPSDVETLSIKYSYYGDSASSLPKEYEKNVIDIAVLDPSGREAGATGSNKKQIIISSNYSTPGYDIRDIEQGQWTIICGAYLVRSEGVEVTYEIEFTYKQYRWLKGDLHTHSVNSDGRLTVEQLGQESVKNGLDYMIITDHNNFFHNKRLPYIKNLTLIPGVEFTHYNGHMNFLGAVTPYSVSYAVNSKEEFIDIINEARANGAIACINHPLCTICPWKWGFDDIDYDIVEVWNGPQRVDNLKAIEWWHNELVKGRKLPAVGGSDYHRDFSIVKMLAKPTTMVYSYSKSQNDILDAIRKGRVLIIKSSTSPFVTITSGDAVVGDTVKLSEDTKVNVSVSCLKRGHTLVVYDKDGIVFSHKAKKSKPYNVEIEVKKKCFIRAEIKYYPKLFERLFYRAVMFVMLRSQAFSEIPEFVSALTNPIYFE